MWLVAGNIIKTLVLFQSTHPRRVWQTTAAKYKSLLTVSIHTPTKGVTCKYLQIDRFTQVSIHTPTKGVTGSIAQAVVFRLFQSTHPRRVWRGFKGKAYLCITVSIHTPTKGVTDFHDEDYYDVWFQSTHPRRVWLSKSLSSNIILSFNPHTHEGCDIILFLVVLFVNHVSIHTPTKGVTLLPLCKNIRRFSFNPHTHEGCDSINLNYMFMDKVSIHTPTKGVTRILSLTLLLSRFQSTHPRRVWLTYGYSPRYAELFQSTHPRRVWQPACERLGET